MEHALPQCSDDRNGKQNTGDGNENIFVLDQVKDKKNTDELWAENITVAEAMKKLNVVVKNSCRSTKADTEYLENGDRMDPGLPAGKSVIRIA